MHANVPVRNATLHVHSSLRASLAGLHGVECHSQLWRRAWRRCRCSPSAEIDKAHVVGRVIPARVDAHWHTRCQSLMDTFDGCGGVSSSLVVSRVGVVATALHSQQHAGRGRRGGRHRRRRKGASNACCDGELGELVGWAIGGNVPAKSWQSRQDQRVRCRNQGWTPLRDTSTTQG
jgi:hypothetical protein